MNQYNVKVALFANSDQEALKKAEVLSKIAASVTLDNLEFLGQLSTKPTINKKLSNPLIRTGIKSKL